MLLMFHGCVKWIGRDGQSSITTMVVNATTEQIAVKLAMREVIDQRNVASIVECCMYQVPASLIIEAARALEPI